MRQIDPAHASATPARPIRASKRSSRTSCRRSASRPGRGRFRGRRTGARRRRADHQAPLASGGGALRAANPHSARRTSSTTSSRRRSGFPYLRPRQSVALARGRADPEAVPWRSSERARVWGRPAWCASRGRFEVVPSEGGHADFGPRSPLEDRLVVFLRGRFGRASRDRILSGGGLALHLRVPEARTASRGRAPAVAAELESAATAPPSSAASACPAAIARAAARWSLFVSIYGSEAGNLALQYRATGGVYVGGGIAPEDPARAAASRVPAVLPRQAADGGAARAHTRARRAGPPAGPLRRGRGRLQHGDRDDPVLLKHDRRGGRPGRSSAPARRRPFLNLSIVSGRPSSSRISSFVIPSLSAVTLVGSVCSATTVPASSRTRLCSELSTAALEPKSGWVIESMMPERVGGPCRSSTRCRPRWRGGGRCVPYDRSSTQLYGRASASARSADGAPAPRAPGWRARRAP